MTQLSKVYGSGPLSLTEISRAEQLPLAYLEQLVGELRRAGLVEGTRGLHGGYRLSGTGRDHHWRDLPGARGADRPGGMHG